MLQASQGALAHTAKPNWSIALLNTKMEQETMSIQMQPLLNTDGLAQITGTSKSYWEKMRMRKEGPRHIVAKGFVRYRWSDVEAWISAHEVSALGDL